MPKNPTKAALNVYCIARKEAATCNDRLASREGAAEETGIDRTRLARIELDSLIPYPEEVLLMAEAYGAPQLCNHYCHSQCPIGRKTIPACELLQLDRLAIKALAAMRRAGTAGNTLLDLTEDGEISEEELPRLDQVVRDLEAMERASMEMRLWIAKHIQQ